MKPATTVTPVLEFASPDDGVAPSTYDRCCALCLGLGGLAGDELAVGGSGPAGQLSLRLAPGWTLRPRYKAVLLVLVLSVLGPAGQQLAQALGLT